MIYTLTLNPAIDYYMEIRGELKEEEVNRGRHEIYKAAGKGLNVSRNLSIMNIPSVAVALLGGFTGKYIEQMFSEDLKIRLEVIRVDGNNRINVKLHDRGRLIAVNGEGPYASAAARQSIRTILSEAGRGDLCVVSGSLMRGIDDEFVISLCRDLREKGVTVVLDSEQFSLETLKACRPDLIKPKLYDLGHLLGVEDPTPENALDIVKEAREAGLRGVLLSLGNKGGILMTDDKIYRMSHPETDLVNMVGSGDAMLAAYIGKITEGVNVEDALRWACAMGTAVASTMDEATLDDVMELFDDITVTEIA